jgi:hypothetical protein
VTEDSKIEGCRNHPKMGRRKKEVEANRLVKHYTGTPQNYPRKFGKSHHSQIEGEAAVRDGMVLSSKSAKITAQTE